MAWWGRNDRAENGPGTELSVILLVQVATSRVLVPAAVHMEGPAVRVVHAKRTARFHNVVGACEIVMLPIHPGESGLKPKAAAVYQGGSRQIASRDHTPRRVCGAREAIPRAVAIRIVATGDCAISNVILST